MNVQTLSTSMLLDSFKEAVVESTRLRIEGTDERALRMQRVKCDNLEEEILRRMAW